MDLLTLGVCVGWGGGREIERERRWERYRWRERGRRQGKREGEKERIKVGEVHRLRGRGSWEVKRERKNNKVGNTRMFAHNSNMYSF